MKNKSAIEEARFAIIFSFSTFFRLISVLKRQHKVCSPTAKTYTVAIGCKIHELKKIILASFSSGFRY